VGAKGAQAAGQRASGLRFALLHDPAGLEGRGAQLPQLLLGGVVGGLQCLSPLGRVPQSGAQVLTVKIRQPSHEFTFGVGISFIPYPLVLTPVV
jgi:hypothetical protein